MGVSSRLPSLWTSDQIIHDSSWCSEVKDEVEAEEEWAAWTPTIGLEEEEVEDMVDTWAEEEEVTEEAEEAEEGNGEEEEEEEEEEVMEVVTSKEDGRVVEAEAGLAMTTMLATVAMVVVVVEGEAINSEITKEVAEATAGTVVVVVVVGTTALVIAAVEEEAATIEEMGARRITMDTAEQQVEEEQEITIPSKIEEASMEADMVVVEVVEEEEVAEDTITKGEAQWRSQWGITTTTVTETGALHNNALIAQDELLVQGHDKVARRLVFAPFRCTPHITRHTQIPKN